MSFANDLKLAGDCHDRHQIFLDCVGKQIKASLQSTYAQDFFNHQNEFYKLIFKPEGTIVNLQNNLFKAHFQARGFFRQISVMYELLKQMAPGGCFFDSISESENLYSIDSHVLPSHIQLLLIDQNVQSNNTCYDTFLKHFRGSIKDGQLKLNPQMILICYILWGMRYGKIQYFEQTKVAMDIVRRKCGKKYIPEDKFVTDQMCTNPYAILIRKILQGLSAHILHNNTYSAKKRDQFNNLELIVVLLHEYLIYEITLTREQLNLTIQQTKYYQRAKIVDKSDNFVIVMYVMLVMNNLYGYRLEQLKFSPAELVQSGSLNRVVTRNLPEKSFFLDTGNLNIYKLLYSWFTICMESKVDNAAIVALYRLFIRWPNAKYEAQVMASSFLFEQLFSSSMLEVRYTPKKNGFWAEIKRIVEYAFPILITDAYIKKMAYSNVFEVIELGDISPDYVKQTQLEFESNKKLYTISRQLHPFYTVLFNKLLIKLGRLEKYEPQDLEQICFFFQLFYSKESDSMMGEMTRLEQYGQIPNYTELKPFCDAICSEMNLDLFKIRTSAREIERLLLILVQQNIGIQQKVANHIADLFQFPRPTKARNTSLVMPLNRSFANGVYRGKVRYSQSKPLDSTWEMPYRDDEFYVSYILMFYFAVLCDVVTCQKKKLKNQQIAKRRSFEDFQYTPGTSWPRCFTGYFGLAIILALVLYLYWKVG